MCVCWEWILNWIYKIEKYGNCFSTVCDDDDDDDQQNIYKKNKKKFAWH